MSECIEDTQVSKTAKIAIGRQINALEVVLIMLVSAYEQAQKKKEWPEADFEQKRVRMREVQSAIRTLQLVEAYQEPFRNLLKTTPLRT